MTTSNTTTWNATTNSIITYAVKYLGKLGEGEQLSSEEYNDCLWWLNAMCKQWIVKNDYAPGLKMWLRKRGFAFLSSTTGTYILGSAGGTGTSYWTEQYQYTTSAGSNNAGASTIKMTTTSAMVIAPQAASNTSSTAALVAGMSIGIQCDDGSLFWSKVLTVPNGTTCTISPSLPVSSNNIGNVIFAFTTIASPPQIIESATLRDAQQNDTPMQILGLSQWMTLPSKQAPGFSGDPISIYYESDLFGNGGAGTGTLYTDVAGSQDISKVVMLSYMTEVQDFVNASDEMYFPKEWAMALTRGLARSIHSMFNAEWTEQQEQETATAFRYAKNAHQKKSGIGFAPGIRGSETQAQWR